MSPRKLRSSKRDVKSDEVDDVLKETEQIKDETPDEKVYDDSSRLLTQSYFITGTLALRYIGFIYFIAFLVAAHQNGFLLGSSGLLPAHLYLEKISYHAGDSLVNKLKYAPTLLWFCDGKDCIDVSLYCMSVVGAVLSLVILLTGRANMVVMLILWVLYHSISSVGQRWYSFGWESQLLESGFLAIFLVRPFSFTSKEMPIALRWTMRWLIFRIMLGAGLIKVRGDQCWRDLTCMNYHYETQPVPNPISYYLHAAPGWWHMTETSANHAVELAAAPLLILPFRLARLPGGVIQILFQVVLIISGNLSFLNWLTIWPAIGCLDDDSSLRCIPISKLQTFCRVDVINKVKASRARVNSRSTLRNGIDNVYQVVLVCLIGYLSVPVVQNLMSSRQAMNTSFDPLKLVNTYGAFGHITKSRSEVIFQGTNSSDPHSPDALWLEYEFPCKPGDVSRRPCWLSPFHYRLDWLMWFAAFQSYQENPWILHLAGKLLTNEGNHLAYNPFEGGGPPKYIRAELYRYEFSASSSKAASIGQWWVREYQRNYVPPVNINALRPVYKEFGWPKIKRI